MQNSAIIMESSVEIPHKIKNKNSTGINYSPYGCPAKNIQMPMQGNIHTSPHLLQHYL